MTGRSSSGSRKTPRAGVVGTSYTLSLIGLSATPVLVEAVQLNGLPSTSIVGLADTAVNEARERLRAGFLTIGVPWPNRRLTVNLSPADLAKSGTGFDLAIATAILGSQGFAALGPETAVIGELGLDGTVRGVRGVLPMALEAQRLGFTRLVVPAANAAEAELVEGLHVTAVRHLAEVAILLGVDVAVPGGLDEIEGELFEETAVGAGDLRDVCGQDDAIWALEVAAAGGHHVLMTGAPGVGKSMLAHRFPAILPDLTSRQAVEVAAIRSLGGKPASGLPVRPPLSSPHHTATTAALVGGGSGVPKPGAITSAHHGVLFCDEFPEFSKQAIQALRQPLEQGWIDLDRVHAHVRYPARFQLIAAANPCRCGHLDDPGGACTCTSRDRMTYKASLGGPVRDRIDISLRLRRPSKAALRQGGTVSSAEVHERVVEARERQLARCFGSTGGESGELNARLPGPWLRKNTPLPESVVTEFGDALSRGRLSMRGVDRIIRLAWTVADLSGHDSPTADDIHVAITLRKQGATNE